MTRNDKVNAACGPLEHCLNAKGVRLNSASLMEALNIVFDAVEKQENESLAEQTSLIIWRRGWEDVCAAAGMTQQEAKIWIDQRLMRFRWGHLQDLCPKCRREFSFIGDTSDGPFKQCSGGHRWYGPKVEVRPENGKAW